MNLKNILVLGYPKNILFLLGVENPNEDQIQGFYYLFKNSKLREKNKELLLCRFQKGMTINEIARVYNISRQAVDAGIKYNLRKIKEDINWNYVKEGYQNYNQILIKEKEEEKNKYRMQLQSRLEKEEENLRNDVLKDCKNNGYMLKDKIIPQTAYHINIYDYSNSISIRLYNILKRSSFKFNGDYDFVSIGNILSKIQESPYWFKDIRNMGAVTAKELYNLFFRLNFLTELEYKYLCAFKQPFSENVKKSDNFNYVKTLEDIYSNLDEWG